MDHTILLFEHIDLIESFKAQFEIPSYHLPNSSYSQSKQYWYNQPMWNSTMYLCIYIHRDTRWQLLQ